MGGAIALSSSQAMSATPSCTLTAEQEEGPYYIDYETMRQDISEGKPGVPLKLRIALVDANRCSPLENAAVDIWHCDAVGVYSGFTAEGGGRGGPGRGPGGPGGPPPGRGNRQTDATRFLRGVQVSDTQGLVEFGTLYPGWYEGRTIHIHLKVHLNGHVSHTGQVFLPEDLTEQIAKLEPYAKHSNVHRTTQSEDHVFTSQHGSGSIASMTRLRNGSNEDGFLATVTVAIDPEATPQLVGGPGRGGPPQNLKSFNP